MLDITSIIKIWENQHNVLLYGPPGTGKTRLLSELHNYLTAETNNSSNTLAITSDASLPLENISSAVSSDEIPRPIKTYWTTFHQSYGYEDFILGYRPSSSEGNITLQPYAGILLDAILELNDDDSDFRSVVIFIDEVNRANTSKVFGEFMTFLDFDYRTSGVIPLPVSLKQLIYENGTSEKIRRLDGSFSTLKSNIYFPKDIYIVCTMNSVDRSAIPIDSALARRFNRIEMPPERLVLEEHWGISVPHSIQNGNDYSPYEVALRLFETLNAHIANDLGAEFELGHGLFLKLTGTHQESLDNETMSNRTWKDLAELWDDIIFPQIEERYAGQPEAILRILRVQEFNDMDYVWQFRKVPSLTESIRILERTRVSGNSIEKIKKSFILLVSDISW